MEIWSKVTSAKKIIVPQCFRQEHPSRFFRCCWLAQPPQIIIFQLFFTDNIKKSSSCCRFSYCFCKHLWQVHVPSSLQPALSFLIATLRMSPFWCLCSQTLQNGYWHCKHSSTRLPFAFTSLTKCRECQESQERRERPACTNPSLKCLEPSVGGRRCPPQGVFNE